MKTENFKDDKPQFNQAFLFVVSLDRLNGDIDVAYMNGLFAQVFRGLQSIYSRIKYKLKMSPDIELFEVKFINVVIDLDKKFEDVSLLLGERSDLAAANISVVEKGLSEIRDRLFDIQWALNLIFPKSMKGNFEDEISEDFK